jgi:hypothetical protein
MAHLTIAANEKTFQALFAAIRDNFHFSHSDSVDFGPFRAGIVVQAKLEGGSVDLRADNTVRVKELDVKWDQLDLSLGIDIPESSIGGFCIIPNPFGGCWVRAPSISVFSGDPDIDINLPLGGIITSEISIIGSLATRYDVNPARPVGMNDWDAQDANPSLANHWQLLLDPQTIDFDIFDIADIVGDLLENALNAAIDNLLGFLPQWARNLLLATLGPVIDLIRDILDLGDDIQEWISDLLKVSFNLLNLILEFVAVYFAQKNPIQLIEDPYPILPEAPNPNPGSPSVIVPVKIPIRDLKVTCNDVEMVMEASVG